MLQDFTHTQRSRLEKVQESLLQTIQKAHRMEALYQLSLITTDCESVTAVSNSSLALAVRNGWTAVVTALLQLNMNPGDADDGGTTGMHSCVRLGNEECARLLLNHRASPDSTVVIEGKRYMFMHVAVSEDHAGIIQLHLEHGSKERNQDNCEKLTPLMVAALMGRTEIARILLQTYDVVVERGSLDQTP
jgi:ankyrin repeat protein